MIQNDITAINFSDKYRCEGILKVHDSGRDKSAIIKKIQGYSNSTIELLVKYKIVEKLGKDWTIERVTDLFKNNSNEVKTIICGFTGENIKDLVKESRCNKIFNSLYESPSYDDDNNLKRSESVVNFINEYFASGKSYNCRVFFNDKPIIIYKSEIDAIKKYKAVILDDGKYINGFEKDGRRLFRLMCLLLAWQKADQNQYYNHREYAIMLLEKLLEYNNVVENRHDATAMISDFKKLIDNGCMEKCIPEVAAPREIAPYMYYRMTFCVDPRNTDTEEIALEITDYEYLWEQIFVAAFGKFDILQKLPDSDIKEAVVTAYNSTDKRGKVHIPGRQKDCTFDCKGKYQVGDKVDVFVCEKGSDKVEILKKRDDKKYVTYRAVKKCSECGRMFYAKQVGNGGGKCDKCNKKSTKKN